MKVSTLLFLLPLMLMCVNGKAQGLDVPVFVSKENITFSRFIEVKLIAEVDKIIGSGSLCLEAASFAKFIVSREGKVENISFVEKTPPEIIKAYRAVLSSTSGLWKPVTVNGEPVDSDPLLLPIVFFFTVGCNGKDQVKQNFYTPLLKILNFDDGIKLEQLKCIILPPSLIGAVD